MSTAATTMGPVLDRLLGPDVPIRFTFWDGSSRDHHDPACTVHFRSPEALRRIAWAPGELGLARAYVAGDLELEGDIFRAAAVLREAAPDNPRELAAAAPTALVAARRLGALGRPLPPPPEEAQVGPGWRRRHSPSRDARVIRHHYDVGNEFYQLVLGPSMTYSCARFPTPGASLEQAQESKHELICRKLGLHERPGQRLLDVGCGWGTMAMHAASRHGATVVAVTISPTQAQAAQKRVAEAGLADRVDIRLQDYRELEGETFDVISSVGMFEHVGRARTEEYFTQLREALAPGGRLLNHAISRPGGTRISNRSFVGRYVFPDGELLDVSETVAAMEGAGFEVRDVEALREHYALTLRGWVANLEERWEEAVALVGEARARVWRLYMAGSVIGFEQGSMSIHQVLGVLPGPEGTSGMPLTRAGWD